MMEEVAISNDTDKVIERADVLDRLYRTEYIGMVRLAYTLVGSNAEAEDLVQDSFVEVARRLDEIRKPGAYLRSAVVSRCRSVLRRRRVMALHPPEPPAGLPNMAGELWDVLGRLPEDQRIVVVLKYYGGYRASEIASIVDMPGATVRSHLRRGLKALREELDS
jgi:DNA-directed RNA polymerase specialized sigma24 family protein